MGPGRPLQPAPRLRDRGRGHLGFAAINGTDREPVLPPMYLADGIAGLYGASAAMIALREVEMNGGHGQVIDLPLLDPLFSILGPSPPTTVSREVKPRTGSRSTTVAGLPHGARWASAASIQKMAERLFSPSAGLTSSTIPSSGRTPTACIERRGAGCDHRRLHRRAHAGGERCLLRGAVTIGPIYDTAQILEDPHFIEREVVADYPDPEMDACRCTTSYPGSEELPGAPGPRARTR